jgi:hypothetical protein
MTWLLALGLLLAAYFVAWRVGVWLDRTENARDRMLDDRPPRPLTRRTETGRHGTLQGAHAKNHGGTNLRASDTESRARSIARKLLLPNEKSKVLDFVGRRWKR